MNDIIAELGLRIASLDWFLRATRLGSEDLVNEIGGRDADPIGLGGGTSALDDQTF